MTRPESPGKKAMRYAEDTLGVQSVYEDAQRARNELDAVLTQLSEARDKRRDLEVALQDAEMEVAREEYSKHPDMAQTRMDKHMKIALNNNDAVREIREQMGKLASDIDGLECDKAIHEADIKIAVARLHELGGYLTYLAAIKTTQPPTPVKSEKPGETA